MTDTNARVTLLEKQFAETSRDIRYIKENIERLVASHDTVVRLTVKAENFEKELKDSKRENEKQVEELKQKDIALSASLNSLWVKVSGLAAGVAFLVSIFNQLGK